MKLNSLFTRKLILAAALFMLLEVFNSEGVFGQAPPPPPPPPNGGINNGHDLGGNQGAPGAPIGGGLEILLALGAFYTAKRVIVSRQKMEEEGDE